MTVDISKIKPGDKVTVGPLEVQRIVLNNIVVILDRDATIVKPDQIAAHHPAPAFKIGDRVQGRMPEWGDATSLGTVSRVDIPCVWVKWDREGLHPVWHVSCLTLVEGGGMSGAFIDTTGQTVTGTRAPDPAVAALEAEVARLRAQYEDERQARLSLQNLAADKIDVSIALLGLLSEARSYVTDALESYEHTDGRDLLNRIDVTLNPAPSENGN